MACRCDDAVSLAKLESNETSQRSTLTKLAQHLGGNAPCATRQTSAKTAESLPEWRPDGPGLARGCELFQRIITLFHIAPPLIGVVCRILLETFHALPCKGPSADPPCSLPRHHDHLVGQPHSGWAAATLSSNFQMQNRGDVRVGGCHQPQLRVEHAAFARLVGVPCSTAFLIGLTWLIRPEAVVVRAFAQAD